MSGNLDSTACRSWPTRANDLTPLRSSDRTHARCTALFFRARLKLTNRPAFFSGFSSDIMCEIGADKPNVKDEPRQ